MKRSEISWHEASVYRALRDAAGEWLTRDDLVAQAAVAPRTASHHALRFVHLNIVDCSEMHPQYRYQLSPQAAVHNREYIDRLELAVKIFGLDETADVI